MPKRVNKMPKWATKMLGNMLLNICCQNIFFGIFTPIKNAGVKAFMKLTPEKILLDLVCEMHYGSFVLRNLLFSILQGYIKISRGK